MRRARRWFLRVLALAALVGVGYGVYTIVTEATEESKATRGPVQGALKRLSAAQEKLGTRLEELRPGASAGGVEAALRRTQRAYEDAVEKLRTEKEQPGEIPDEAALDDALGKEFDYLDALRSALTNFRSPLLRSLGDRAQAAFDAFSDLPDSEGVEEGIRGTQAFLAWARARSDGER